jgi:hypothetical protein
MEEVHIVQNQSHCFHSMPFVFPLFLQKLKPKKKNARKKEKK